MEIKKQCRKISLNLREKGNPDILFTKNKKYARIGHRKTKFTLKEVNG